MLAPGGVVIVGAGQAAAELAVSLRQQGYGETITLIGDEPCLPYHRPPLSKGLLAGALQTDAVLIRGQAAYAKAGIDLRLGTRVQRIEREHARVRLDTGDTLTYGALVLATGGRARRLALPGAEHPRVMTLRSMADVQRLREHFRPGQRLVIIGAGYVGLEVAAIAAQAGLDVQVLESADRVLARVVTPQLSAYYQQVHARAGVAISTGISLSAIVEEPDAALRVCAKQGASWLADVVLVGVGLEPDVALARDAGIEVGNGILIDEFGRTSAPSIFAIGDCANHFNAFAGRRLRLESVQNAVEQARAVASWLCGKPVAHCIVPWFWSDQYHLKLQMAGLCEGHDHVVLRGTLAADSFSMFYLRAGQVIAVDAVNRPAEFQHARRLIANGGNGFSVEQLADEAVSLKEGAA
ncbi:FAD-dependent pyridine nucleotide-disulfide oxidoreductase [Pseudomonas sp. M47T1]|uniref:NAD(P)/FAD-dependent oxidoreductase n=1 Tax=Pseudomonas sp. M47T1 TaxID=1179778 RepID=UPI00026075CA|nr:FAD-dependent oxidoreductase [Pseudomonas sp. M47T1]EIK95774.1 FAD-dependent pyridine nucleotide-disulfide oxidoreductase [Pseudomonas sp. M47T1]